MFIPAQLDQRKQCNSSPQPVSPLPYLPHSSSKDASANVTSGSIDDVTPVSSVGISLLQPPPLIAGAGAGDSS
ncbi:hypothetical protein V2G26_003442 [Clonostachys chloroleuca]